MSTAVRTPLWRSSQNFKKAKFAFLGFSEAQLPSLLHHQHLGCAPSRSSAIAPSSGLDSPSLAISVSVDAHARW
jgi:hypothetical protein